jgi:hypothetical protein
LEPIRIGGLQHLISRIRSDFAALTHSADVLKRMARREPVAPGERTLDGG